MTALTFTSKCEIRNFLDGDEYKIVKLFNDVYGSLAGYVPRTVEYWRWCCLKRPDVTKSGIFLAFDEGTGDLEGYVVAGLSGNIWEFCCRPDREEVALTLLDRAVSYLESMSVSAANLNVPEDDDFLNKVCKKMDFAKVNVNKMFVGVLSFNKLVSLLIQDKTAPICKKFNEKICIIVKDAPFWIEKAVSVNIYNDEVDVSEDMLESPTISVQTDFKTLSSVLFGILSPWRAFLGFKMSIKPFWKVPTLMGFLNSISLDNSWFWPLADFG